MRASPLSFRGIGGLGTGDWVTKNSTFLLKVLIWNDYTSVIAKERSRSFLIPYLIKLYTSGIRQTQKSLPPATEVSDRTIRSDLDFLGDRYSAPLEYQKDKGWHYSDPDWRLPSISLSQGELFALTLGARMLENYAGSAYVNELRTAIARLGERLPEATWVDLQKIADERILFSSGASITLDPEIWHKLELACKETKSVWMEYFTASRMLNHF